MTWIMVIGWAGTAAAQTSVADTGFELSIPIETVVRAPEGSVTELAAADVPAEALGQTCSVKSVANNQVSVHPNNDLIVASGDSEVVIPNVERARGVVTEATGTITLGSSITVSLHMGEDEVFSGGFHVVIDCEPLPGRIIVVKEVTEGSDTTQSFGFEADYDSDGFALVDGEQNDSGELAPGTYSVDEIVPEGWTLQSSTCDDGSSVGAIELNGNETVTCTFVNDQTEVEPEPGRIIVVKEVTEGPTTQSFGFEADYDSDGFALSHGEQNDSGELAPGTYSVDEIVPEGWTLQSSTCDDGSSHDAIDLSAGETVTCTFVNGQVDDLVLAAIEVTVDGRCEVDGDQGVGLIDVTISVDGGATVVATDSDGDVVGTVTSGDTIEVAEGATYHWEATPSEGFEFLAGADDSGSITIETCSDAETLPFTGPETDGLVVLATVLLAIGALVLSTIPNQEA